MFVHAGMTLVVSGDGRYFSKDAIQVHSCPFARIFLSSCLYMVLDW